jgi:hypothetical protein
LEEYAKRKVILKAKFSSSITSGGKTRPWQEIANIVNAGNECLPAQRKKSMHYLSIEKLKRNYPG